MKRIWPLLIALSAVSVSFSPLAAQRPPLAAAPLAPPADLAQARAAGLDYLRVIASDKGLDAAGDLRVSGATIDGLSMAHTRVQQYFRGVPVFGGEAIAHLTADGALFAETDSLVSNINVSTVPRLTADAAIGIATADYGCTDCLTAPPKADLWMLRQDGVDHLVYRVQLTRLDGSNQTALPVRFIDAQSGYVVRAYDNLQTGTGTSLYSGTVTIGTSFSPTNGVYLMENLVRRIGTATWANTTNSLFRMGDSDDVWDSGAQRAGVDAQYGAEQFLDYLQAVHGRNGIDGNGGPRAFLAHDGGGAFWSTVHYGSAYNNAFWTGSFMVYGDGDNSLFSPLVSLDIAGHEMMHGVTQFTAGLVYQGESGALNESWSDVFGAMLERYVKGEGPNTWWLAEQAYTPGVPGDALRFMDNPHQASNNGLTSDDDPDHYSERYTGALDNGGVHTNSGIANKAFYLLAQGGTHHLGGTMAGIGADKAVRIWYSALTSYMTSSTDFAGARTATIQAATAIFGEGSTEAFAVENAWCLVGVGLCHVDAIAVTPNSGSGMSRAFTLTYMDPLGASADLAAAQIRFAATNAAAGSCTVHYRATTNLVRIQNDAGAWGPWTPFGSGTLSNSQCEVDLALGGATPSGTDLSLALHVTFSDSFRGPKNIYMRAAGATGADSGWVLRGGWQVGAAVEAIAATPNSGAGLAESFELTYSDAAGVAADLLTAQVRIASSNSAAGSCTIHYRATTGMMRMQDDAGVYGQWMALGSGTLSNSQCVLDLASSTATPNSTNLTLDLSLTFKTAFHGHKKIYMRAASATGTDTGWALRGTWDVGAAVDALSVTPSGTIGKTQTFTLAYSDSAGVTADLTGAHVRFAALNDAAGSCTIHYRATTGMVRIQDDAGVAGPWAALGGGTLSNSQCVLDLALSSAVAAGTNLTLSLSITFRGSFAGTKNIYMRAVSATTLETGWVLRGTWIVPARGANILSVAPAAGSGATQAFTLRYWDTSGAGNLTAARVRIAPTNAAPASCTVSYNAVAGTVSLQNDAGTAWTTGVMGSGSLSNSQCILDLTASNATINGNDLTIVLSITFRGSFAGDKRVFMLGMDAEGSTGWQRRGSWTVPVPVPSTALFLDSQTGDYIGRGVRQTLTPADGTFSITRNYNGGVSATVIGPQYSFFWYLDFAAEGDAPLQVGSYGNATRYPFSEFVGMAISGNGGGCNQLTGRFRVLEISYDAGGNVQRFAVDFEQHCEDADPALFGALRFNSTISTPLEPFNGLYPSYSLRIVPPTGGTVSGSGFECGTGGPTCAVTLGSPATVNLTARPSPGYFFLGWTGSCRGARTIAVKVNSEEDCTALFDPIVPPASRTLLFWNSQEGDNVGAGSREIYGPANSHWSFTAWDVGVQLMIDSVAGAENPWLRFRFDPPTGQPLVPGVYENVTRFSSETTGAIDVTGNGRGCSATFGRFVVHEIAIADGVVTNLALDFEQHCENRTIPARPLLGSIRYASAVPIQASLALTFAGHGSVTIDPTGTVCTYNCTETYAVGTSVQLTATADPGWSFVSWSGDADCLDGAVKMTAPTACRATFQQQAVAPSESQSGP